MEFLLTLILIIVVISFLVRRLLPFIVMRAIERRINKFSGGDVRFGGEFRSRGRREKREEKRREGSVTVNGRGGEKMVGDEVGEYVDFKEIK